jgi:hypothetical protein
MGLPGATWGHLCYQPKVEMQEATYKASKNPKVQALFGEL